MARAKKTKTEVFYVLTYVNGEDAFILFEDDGVRPRVFDNEVEAIEKAKEYGSDTVVVKGVARIKEHHSITVERL